jgi:5-methylcytosine-specific restriction endonuclease McrA
MSKNDSISGKRKQFVVGTLRRASMRWPPRNEIIKNARVDRGLYECAMCKGHFKREYIDIDHIIPVIDVQSGFTNWEDYVTRLLPDVDGFQALCKTCHESKTILEDHMRTNKSKMEKERVKFEKKKQKEQEKMKKYLEYVDKKNQE